MNIRESLIGMIKAFPGGWDAMAGALGMGRIPLQNRIYECRGMEVGVSTALLMQDFSQTKLFAEAVAAQSGGTFLMLPEVGDIDGEEISEKFHAAMEQFGILSAEYRAATKDGVVDKREREKLNAIIDRMHQIMDEIRALTFKYFCHETKANAQGDL